MALTLIPIDIPHKRKSETHARGRPPPHEPGGQRHKWSRLRTTNCILLDLKDKHLP